MKIKDVVICGFSIPEDLYHLISTYSSPEEFEKNPSKETLRNFIDSGIYNSKQSIPELYNEAREYPPLLYYIILSYIQIKQPYSKTWRMRTKEEKEETVNSCYSWLEELKHNIKDEKDNLLF